MRVGFFGDSLTEGFPGASFFQILAARLPGEDLLNFGRGGDTVKSLLRRLDRTVLPESLDLAFLWIGVNDILVRTSRSYPWLKRLRRQPWARSREEFSAIYAVLVSRLLGAAGRLVVVPPLLIGENPENRWNRELNELSFLIGRTVGGLPRVEFLDVRKPFLQILAGGPSSEYVPRKALGMLLRARLARAGKGSPDPPTEKGLRLTVDGVHLNPRGAGIAAGLFETAIRRFSPPAA